MNKKIIVLMSTYNGEKYLEEQISSILQQEDVCVDLVIRDDGSTDSTWDVINKYDSLSNVTLLKGDNCGVGNAFMQILYESKDADYYAFADQDDIWLPNKLKAAVEMIEAEIDGPVLYASNQTVADEKANPIEQRYKEMPPMDLVNTIIGNNLAGCTMVMNRNLRDILIKTECRPQKEFLKVRIHDAWVSAFALCVGKIIYDDNSYMLYRQHINNVVGSKEPAIIERIKNYFKYRKNYNETHYRSYMARELSRCTLNQHISSETKKLLDTFINTSNIMGRFKFCFDKQIFNDRLSCNAVVLKIKVILGMI